MTTVVNHVSKKNLKNRLLSFKAPIATKVACFSCLLKCLRSLYNKQCGPRSTPIGAVWSGSCLFASMFEFVSNVRQLFAADDFSRHHFSDAIFLGALRVIYRLRQMGNGAWSEYQKCMKHSDVATLHNSRNSHNSRFVRTPCSLAATFVNSHLLITFANSLDPDQDRHYVQTVWTQIRTNRMLVQI